MKPITVEQALYDYAKHAEIKGVKNLQAVRYAQRHLRLAFGTVSAESLTTETIEAWMSKMVTAEYKPKAKATVDRWLTVLSAAFHLAYNNRKMKYLPKIHMFHPFNTRQGFFVPVEFQAILEQIAIDRLADPVHCHMAEFAYNSGRRPGELQDMQQKNVFRDEGVIRLPETKNGQTSSIVIEGPLARILEARDNCRINPNDPEEYVFHINGKPVTSSQRNRVWRRARERAGFPNKIFYDMRRSTARDLIAADVDIRTAMDILGQKTRSMYDRYHIQSMKQIRHGVMAMVALRQGQTAQSLDTVPTCLVPR